MTSRAAREAAETAKKLQLMLAELQKPSAFDADVTDDDKSEDGPTVGRRLRNQENVSPPRVAWRADMTEDETGPSSDVSEVMHGSPRASRGRKPRREANASVCESSFGGDGLEGAELMSEDAFMESWGRIARSGDALDKVLQQKGPGKARAAPTGQSDATASASDGESTPVNDNDTAPGAPPGQPRGDPHPVTQLWGVEPKAQEDPSISAQWRQAHGAARPAALGTERTGQEWLRKKKGSFRLAHSVDFFRHGLREEMHTTAIRDASTPVKGPTLPGQERRGAMSAPRMPRRDRSSPSARPAHRRAPSDPHVAQVARDPKPWQRNPWGGHEGVRRAPDIGVPKRKATPLRGEHWVLQRARELGPGSINQLSELLREHIANVDHRLEDLEKKRKERGFWHQAQLPKQPYNLPPGAPMQGDPTYKGVAVVPAPGGGAHLKRVDDAVSAFSHATANSLGHAHLTDHFARSRSGFGTSRDSQAPVGRQMPWEQRTDLLVAGVRDRLPRMSSDMVREGPPRHGHSPYGSLAERRMSMDGTRSVSAPRPPRHPSREPGHSRRVSFHESVEEITRHRTGLPSRGVSPVGLRDVAEAQNQGKKGKKTSKKKKKKKASPAKAKTPSSARRLTPCTARTPTSAARTPSSAPRTPATPPHGMPAGTPPGKVSPAPSTTAADPQTEIAVLVDQLRKKIESQQSRTDPDNEKGSTVLDVLRVLEATVTGHASPRKGALEDPDEGRWEGEENKDGKRKGARAGRGTQARHGMESHAPPALQDDALFVSNIGGEHSRLRALARLGLVPEPPSIVQQMKAERRRRAKQAIPAAPPPASPVQAPPPERSSSAVSPPPHHAARAPSAAGTSAPPTPRSARSVGQRPVWRPAGAPPRIPQSESSGGLRTAASSAGHHAHTDDTAASRRPPHEAGRPGMVGVAEVDLAPDGRALGPDSQPMTPALSGALPVSSVPSVQRDWDDVEGPHLAHGPDASGLDGLSALATLMEGEDEHEPTPSRMPPVQPGSSEGPPARETPAPQQSQPEKSTQQERGAAPSGTPIPSGQMSVSGSTPPRHRLTRSATEGVAAALSASRVSGDDGDNGDADPILASPGSVAGPHARRHTRDSSRGLLSKQTSEDFAKGEADEATSEPRGPDTPTRRILTRARSSMSPPRRRGSSGIAISGGHYRTVGPAELRIDMPLSTAAPIGPESLHSRASSAPRAGVHLRNMSMDSAPVGGGYATREAIRKELRGRRREPSVGGVGRARSRQASVVGAEEWTESGAEGRASKEDEAAERSMGRSGTWHPGGAEQEEGRRVQQSMSVEERLLHGPQGGHAPKRKLETVRSITGNADQGDEAGASQRRPDSPLSAEDPFMDEPADEPSASISLAQGPRALQPRSPSPGVPPSPRTPDRSTADPVTDMLEQETRNRANSEAQRFLIDDDPSPGGQEASWPPSQHSTPQQGTSTPARTPNQTPSQTPGPSPGLGGLRAMFSGVDSTPPQGFSTPSPGAPARAPSGDLQWESGSDIVIGDSPGGGAPPPERRMPSATAPTGGGRDGSGWEVGQGAAQDPWGHAEGPPGPSASMGDDDMPWQSYRPDPEQERRATMALQLRQAIQGLEPQIMAMTVQRALEVLREGERMHKHKTVNSGSAKKKGSDRRMQVVVRPAPGGGAYEVVLSYKGGVMGMKARQYVVTSFETSMGALRGTAPLSINVHTTQGTVDLTCTNIKQWCLFAAGLNAALHTRDISLGSRGLGTLLSSLDWHPAGIIL